MKLIIIGCEYTGTTTLSKNLFEWSQKNMTEGISIIHDHWKIPDTWGHPHSKSKLKGMTPEEQTQVMNLSPRLLENMQRQSLYYHMPRKDNNHYIVVGHYIEDGIYAPIYFNYGIDGPFDVNRSVIMKEVEKEILEICPEIVLVLLTTSIDEIVSRMQKKPHKSNVITKKDISQISKRFLEEFEKSNISNKIKIDTSKKTEHETFNEFLEKYLEFMGDHDKLSILLKKQMKNQKWL